MSAWWDDRDLAGRICVYCGFRHGADARCHDTCGVCADLALEVPDAR